MSLDIWNEHAMLDNIAIDRVTRIYYLNNSECFSCIGFREVKESVDFRSREITKRSINTTKKDSNNRKVCIIPVWAPQIFNQTARRVDVKDKHTLLYCLLKLILVLDSQDENRDHWWAARNQMFTGWQRAWWKLN